MYYIFYIKEIFKIIMVKSTIPEFRSWFFLHDLTQNTKFTVLETIETNESMCIL